MARQDPTASSPVVTSPEALRNVVLVGPSGSGKTKLFDHLVATTTPRYRPPHREREGSRSNALEVATVEHGDLVINLIDTPGAPDFVGELRAGLRAADAAVFVVSAPDGVDATTRTLWHECKQVGAPLAVVLTKLDTPHADHDAAIIDCQAAFGEGVMPLGIPLVNTEANTLDAIVDLVLGEVHDYTGDAREVRPTSEEHIGFFDTYHAPLMEGIITEAEDDTLLDRYLGGEEIGFEVVEEALLTAVARGSFHPVVPVSSATGAGIDVLLHLIGAAFPPPTRARRPRTFTPAGGEGPEIAVDPDGPLVAQIITSRSDAYVGHVSLVRVFGGTLRPEDTVHASGRLGRFTGHVEESRPDHDEDVRVGALSAPLGEGTRHKDHAIAGELAIVQKLPGASSDTLSSSDSPVVVEPWSMPDALLPAAITPATRTDEDKLPAALQRLGGSDPSLRVEHNAETGQTILWTMGQTHLELVLSRLAEEFDVSVDVVPVRIALRETFVGAASAKGRHVKQSGGHGQYAICDITVEPLERGAGFEFVDKVVGGAVPRQFIPSVEKGVLAQLERGVVAGYPMVDVRVTLLDGKAHSVDSSDAAFQTAGALALREAAIGEGVTAMLEPVDLLTVTVPDDHLGAVMTDVSTRRGRIQGTETSDQEGFSVVKAEVPQAELVRYAIELRALSQGAGHFERQMLGYELMPEHLVAEHIGT